MSTRTYGRIGYEAYAESTGGKTWDGRDMPTWEQLAGNTPKIATAWEAAAAAIANALAEEPLPSTVRNDR